MLLKLKFYPPLNWLILLHKTNKFAQGLLNHQDATRPGSENLGYDKIIDCLGEFLTFISQQYVSRTRFLPCNVLNMKANFLKVKEE